MEQGQTNAARRWRKRRDSYRVGQDHSLSEVDDGKVVCVELGARDVTIGLPDAVRAVGCTFWVCVTRSTHGRGLAVASPRTEQLVPQPWALAPAQVGTTLRAFSCGLKWHLLLREPGPAIDYTLRTDFAGGRIRDLPNSVGGQDDVVSRRFVEEAAARFLPRGGGSMHGDLAMAGAVVVSPQAGSNGEVVSAAYVDAGFSATDIAFRRVTLGGRLFVGPGSIVRVDAPEGDADMANKAFVVATANSPDRTMGDVRVTLSMVAGRLLLRTAPTQADHAVPKEYVDRALGPVPAFMHRTKTSPQTVAPGQAALSWPGQTSAVGVAYSETATDAFVTIGTAGVYAVAWFAHRLLAEASLELWVSVDPPVGAVGGIRHGAFKLAQATAGTGLACLALGAGSRLRTMCFNAAAGADTLPPSAAPQDGMQLSVVRVA